MSAPLELVLMWHMHQPEYRDYASREFRRQLWRCWRWGPPGTVQQPEEELWVAPQDTAEQLRTGKQAHQPG